MLRRLDLDFPAGQFLAVVGRSGGGKTTLMRLIAGLDAATSGTVRINGAAVSGLQRDVRLLFQDARLVPLAAGARKCGHRPRAGLAPCGQPRAQGWGLGDRAGNGPSCSPGGQKQRVALARALVSNPSVLLLDEPFGALDALTRVEMHRLLERIWRERGFTVVLITHDVAEAVALADRVVVLRAGEIALDQTIDLPRPRREAAMPAASSLQARILAAV